MSQNARAHSAFVGQLIPTGTRSDSMQLGFDATYAEKASKEHQKEDNTSRFKLPVEILRTVFEYVSLVSVARFFLEATRQLQTLAFETRSIWRRIWLSDDAIPSSVSAGSTQTCTSEGHVNHISTPNGTVVHRKLTLTLRSKVGVARITERHAGLLRQIAFNHTSTLCIVLNRKIILPVITSSLRDAFQGRLPHLESLTIARPRAVETFYDGLSIVPDGISISPLGFKYISFENVCKHFTTSSPTATRNAFESLDIQVFLTTRPNIVLSLFSSDLVATLTPSTLYVDPSVKFLLESPRPMPIYSKSISRGKISHLYGPEPRTMPIYSLPLTGIPFPSLRVLQISSTVSSRPSIWPDTLGLSLSTLENVDVDPVTEMVADGDVRYRRFRHSDAVADNLIELEALGASDYPTADTSNNTETDIITSQKIYDQHDMTSYVETPYNVTITPPWFVPITPSYDQMNTGSTGPDLPSMVTNTDVPELSGQVVIPDREAVFVGTYSKVYSGFYATRKVAVKMLHPFKCARIMKRKFRRELSISWSLRHPNVLSLYGYFFEYDDKGNIHYSLVSKWAEGGSAAQYIYSRNLSWNRKLTLVHNVANGLTYLHSFIVHGDLKPDNVLIDEHGVAQIGDFGLSRLMQDYEGTPLNTTTDHTGTVRYLAKELVATKKAVPTRATDVYALGCLALEFIYQTRPHATLDLAWRISSAIYEGRPPAKRPPDSEDILILWDLLDCCWSTDASERPTAKGFFEYLDENQGAIENALSLIYRDPGDPRGDSD